MKQIIQHLRSGKTSLEEIPVPEVRPGYVLIRSVISLVSAGTEKMIVEFSKSNLISKARKHPDRVEQVLNKIKADGLLPTLEAVFNKLDEPLPLGYCNAGVVVKVGDDVQEFKIGDRVASNGSHAEFVCVPKNLVVKIPDQVSFEEAAFTPVGAIALQGIRLIHPQLGDVIVVVGLGLIGLLTAQLLNASGVRVIGFDISEKRIEIAKQLNIKAFNADSVDIIQTIQHETNSAGVDAVIIAASSKNSEIINTAAKICRRKGKIVMVGVTGIDINRDEFYKKELSFQVSCSYGPGRYDESYEQDGLDYPLPFVRYTAKRNFESFLNAVALKSISLEPLITRKTDLADFSAIYEHLSDTFSIASLLVYSNAPPESNLISVQSNKYAKGKVTIGIIGAGNFTKSTMLPALQNAGASIKFIASANGLNAGLLAKKYNIPHATTDVDYILNDIDVNFVMITTRHDQHAKYIIKSLEAGKHVFCEKPLAIHEQQLSEIIECKEKFPDQQLHIGFNRRSSALAQKAKKLIGDARNSNIVITVNAGPLPIGHWLMDNSVGGGRIVGEGCHFFDLAAYLADSEIISVFASSNGTHQTDESFIIQLKFNNGAQAVINYLTNGHRSFPKETIEIFSSGRILVVDNFRKLTGYGVRHFSPLVSRQNKGHKDQFTMMLKCIEQGLDPIIPFSSIVNTTKATFAALVSATENRVVSIT